MTWREQMEEKAQEYAAIRREAQEADQYQALRGDTDGPAPDDTPEVVAALEALLECARSRKEGQDGE